MAAVGSRSLEKAKGFAREHGAERAHGSYEELAADPGVDAIYVATPHTDHCASTLICLRARKAVLCEKPFAVNRSEAEQMIGAARDGGIFLMEAIWSRCFPLMTKVRELLAEGAIGEPRMLNADFGFRSGWNPEGRLLNPALAGGALLDVGVYVVSLAHMVFGRPEAVTGLAHIGESGVDEQSAMILRHGGGALSVLSAAVRTPTPQAAVILGTDGAIRILSPWWKPKVMVLKNAKGETEIEFPWEGNGYQFEALEVAACLAAGKLESPVIPWSETIEVMSTMDTLRAQWGLKYPCEG